MSDFFMCVKSTVDRLALDLSRKLDVDSYIDIDDRTNNAELQAGGEPAVVWQLATFKPQPRDPLHQMVFALGIKTANDPGNFELTRLFSEINSLVAVDATIQVMDYTGEEEPTVSEGFIYIASVSDNQMLYDKMSNVRLHEVQARVVRTR